MVKRKKKAKRSGKETIDDGSEDEDGDTHDEKDDDIGAWGNEGEYYLDDELDGEDEEMHLRGLEEHSESSSRRKTSMIMAIMRIREEKGKRWQK